MDVGRIAVDEETTLYLFGMPGQGVGFMWDILSDGVLGYVVVVDSADRDTLGDTRKILDFFRLLDIPFVVAANKQDKEKALNVSEIKKGLFLEEKVKVLPCVATNKESVKEVLLSLLYEVMELLPER